MLITPERKVPQRQTWNLSKILHRRIFRIKILHRQFHLFFTVYTAGKNFTLPPALTGWTNSTSAHFIPYLLKLDFLERISHKWVKREFKAGTQETKYLRSFSHARIYTLHMCRKNTNCIFTRNTSEVSSSCQHTCEEKIPANDQAKARVTSIQSREFKFLIWKDATTQS